MDTGLPRRQRHAKLGPAEIGRKMKRLRNEAGSRRDRARILATERDDFNRLPELQESTRQTVDISADAGCRRVEGAAVDADAEDRWCQRA